MQNDVVSDEVNEPAVWNEIDADSRRNQLLLCYESHGTIKLQASTMKVGDIISCRIHSLIQKKNSRKQSFT